MVVAVAAATAGARSCRAALVDLAPPPSAVAGHGRPTLAIDDATTAPGCARTVPDVAAVAARTAGHHPAALAALSAALAAAAAGRATEFPCLLDAAARAASAAA